jgi:hypothetical protein
MRRIDAEAVAEKHPAANPGTRAKRRDASTAQSEAPTS